MWVWSLCLTALMSLSPVPEISKQFSFLKEKRYPIPASVSQGYKISLIMLDFQGLFSSLELVLSFSVPQHQINNYPSGGAELR